MAVCPRCQLVLDDDVQFCPQDGARLTVRVSPGKLPALAPDADDEHIGQLLGDEFEILSVTGKGAMGTVYKAEQRAMDRLVAVKILKRELVRDTGLVRRFVREARATAKLSHPNIVTVHFVGETPEGLPFLVMEYVDARSLEAVCEKPVPLGRTLDLARQIVSALSDAHDAGIIHRDLKPSNILVVERHGQPDRVKVVDFGIAKILEWGDNRESMLTQGGVIFGTPDYLAPEQAAGKPVDARTDLYALGVILFRLVTGELPFRGTGMQLVLKHLREVPPLPSSLAPDLPPDVEELIVMLLSKDPDHRPPTARAVEVTLERLASTLASGGAASSLPPVVVKKVAAKAAPTAAVKKASPRPRPVPVAPEPADDAEDESAEAGVVSSGRGLRRALFGLAAAIGVGIGGGLWLARSRHHQDLAPVTPTVVAAVAPVVPAPVATPVRPVVAPLAKKKLHRDDDGAMPVTVIPASPGSAPAAYPTVPLRLPNTGPTTANHAAPKPPAAPPPPAPPAPRVQLVEEQSVVVTQVPPKRAPESAPPPVHAEPAENDPPPREPDRPADPTTLPLPANP